MEAIEKAIDIVGSRIKLARELECTPQLVGMMVNGKTAITAEHAMKIQLATNHRVMAYDLRPDLPWGAVCIAKPIEKPAKSTGFGPDDMTEVSRDIAEAYMKHRKAMKAPLSAIAWRAIVKEAVKAGWSVEDAVTEGIARGWKAFKAEWVSKKETVQAKYNPSVFGNVIEGELSEPKRIRDI